MLHDYSNVRVKGWVYDSSMPSKVFRDPALWPYSLDHLTIQDCDIGKFYLGEPERGPGQRR